MYNKQMLEDVLYGEARQFIEFGGFACIYPIEDLPYLRERMIAKGEEARWRSFAASNGPLIDRVRSVVRERRAVRKRELDGSAIDNYRGSKDSGVALYYLWLIGELATLRRDGVEAVYAPFEDVVPAAYQGSADVGDSRRFHIEKTVAAYGVCPAKKAGDRRIVGELIEQGRLIEVSSERGESHLVTSKNINVLSQSAASSAPEASLLSPLDIVVARGRALEVFGVPYIWEIYKKPENRKFGPYTMPILFDDAIVGRIDLGRTPGGSGLRINGFWREDDVARSDEADHALCDAVARMARFVGATEVIPGDGGADFDLDECNAALALLSSTAPG